MQCPHPCGLCRNIPQERHGSNFFLLLMYQFWVSKRWNLFSTDESYDLTFGDHGDRVPWRLLRNVGSMLAYSAFTLHIRSSFEGVKARPLTLVEFVHTILN